MKILHIALTPRKQMALERALRSMGKYVQLDWQKAQQHGSLEKELRAILQRFKPDFTFAQIQTGGVFTPELINLIPGFKMNWSGDVREPLPEWYAELAPHFNVTCFTNMEDIYTLRESAHRADYLQIGYDERVYNTRQPRIKCPPIVFMANHYAGMFPLTDFRMELIERFQAEFGEDFGLYGNIPGAINLNDNPQMEARIYANCKVAINVSHFKRERYTSDRMLRIMGCGAACFSHTYPEMEKDFPDTTHFKIDSIDDAVERCKMILTATGVDIVANRGYNHVRTHHTWKARMKDLKELIEKYR